MKKLKRLTLNNGTYLSPAEMTCLCGGEFLPFDCSKEYDRCSIQVDGGVDTGYCKWVQTSPTQRNLYCVPD